MDLTVHLYRPVNFSVDCSWASMMLNFLGQKNQKVSEYDQEMSQSHTTDQLTAS